MADLPGRKAGTTSGEKGVVVVVGLVRVCTFPAGEEQDKAIAVVRVTFGSDSLPHRTSLGIYKVMENNQRDHRLVATRAAGLTLLNSRMQLISDRVALAQNAVLLARPP